LAPARAQQPLARIRATPDIVSFHDGGARSEHLAKIRAI
jgi:hypothetical protein